MFCYLTAECCRETKKEKNVLNVFKAEDIEGHKGEDDLNSVLQVNIRHGGGRGGI